MSTLPSGSAC